MFRPLTRILCFGDSITEADGPCELEKWPALLQLNLNSKRSSLFEVYNRGRSGDTTCLALDRIYTILPLLPAWVIVAFGVNDANVRSHRLRARVGLRQFEENLLEMSKLIESAGGRIIYLVTHSPIPERGSSQKYGQGNKNSYAENFSDYRQIMKRVGTERGSPMIDIDECLINANITAREIVISDGLHLSHQGNRWYAAQVSEALHDLVF